MKHFGCQNFVESIDFYLQDELDQETHQAFEKQKESCEMCELTLQESQVLHSAFSIYRQQQVEYSHDKDALLDQILQRAKEQKEEVSWFQSFINFISQIKNITQVKKRWVLLPLPAVALTVGFIFFSTVAFKSPLIDFAVSSHEQPWPSEVETTQLNEVKTWFSKHSDHQQSIDIPRFNRLPNAEIKLEMARLSLVMSAPKQWTKAAHLLYTFAPNKKITVLAFHGKNSNIHADAEHIINKIPVQLTHTTDLTIAHYQRAGISYVVTSNLHDAELLKLIQADLTSY